MPGLGNWFLDWRRVVLVVVVRMATAGLYRVGPTFGHTCASLERGRRGRPASVAILFGTQRLALRFLCRFTLSKPLRFKAEDVRRRSGRGEQCFSSAGPRFR